MSTVRISGSLTATTGFIGRTRELTLVESLLARPEVRLVNVRGPGGIGKTALAREVLSRQTPEHDAVSGLVELAGLRDAALALPAVAAALHVPVRAQGPLDAIHAHVGDRHALLVLDNLEHLHGVEAEVSALLGACPNLKLVTTSRTVLGVDEAYDVTLEGLGIPSDDGDPLASESVALFVHRARHVRPELDVTPEVLTEVASICRSLEGVPLALELAASQLRVLGVRDVRERLARPLDLLVRGSREAHDRHGSLRATLEWSYALLDVEDRALFECCAVFTGGFTPSALEAVWGEPNMLERVTRLVEQSFVLSVGDVVTRWRLLEPLRELALEKLARSPRATGWRERHTQYFLALAERHGSADGWTLPSPDSTACLLQEMPNLRAALERALSEGQIEIAARLVQALHLHWYVRGEYDEGRGWTERLLSLSRQLERPEATLVALHVNRRFLKFHPEAAETRAQLEEALALCGRLGDAPREADVRLALAGTERSAGRHDAASELIRSAYDQYETLGLRVGAAVALSSLAWLHWDAGNVDAALALYPECARRMEELDDTYGMASVQLWWGLLLRLCGDWRAAREHLLVALDISSRGGFMAQRADAIFSLAAVESALGSSERAVRWAAVSARLLEEAHATGRQALPTQSAQRAWLDEARAHLGQARFERAWQSGLHASDAAFVAELTAWRAAAGSAASAAPPEVACLTPREREVLSLVAEGHPDRKIALLLGVSRKTASTHVSNLLGKLGLKNRVQLTRWAMTRPDE